MKKIKWSLEIGFPSAVQRGEIEVDDDATDEEIEESVQDATNQHIDIGWEVVK